MITTNEIHSTFEGQSLDDVGAETMDHACMA